MRKKSTLQKYLFLICFVPSITFAQLSSQQIDSFMEVALLKFKVAGTTVAVAS